MAGSNDVTSSGSPVSGLDQPVSRIRQAIAGRLVRTTSVPQFTLSRTIDARAALQLTEQAEGLTLTHLLLRAVGTALVRVAGVNRIWVEEGPRLRALEKNNVGLAIASDDNPIVATIPEPAGLSLEELVQTTRRAVDEGRAGRLPAAFTEPAAVTVSNLGMFGVDRFEAIVDPGQTAVLAVGRVVERPAVTDAGIAAVKQLDLTLTVDHRTVDGAEGRTLPRGDLRAARGAGSRCLTSTARSTPAKSCYAGSVASNRSPACGWRLSATGANVGCGCSSSGPARDSSSTSSSTGRFDIGRCQQKGRSLAWTGRPGFTGPWFYEPEGLGFLRSFGAGLLTTCGLDHAFAAAEDTAEQYHYPAKPVERYGLHGRVSGIPARLAAYGEEWRGDECVLYAEGEVLQAAVFGEQLLLRRRIEARVGESRPSIRDQVVNVGYDTTPHMLLYHVNLGWPVVDEGSELLAPATAVRARGDYQADGYGLLHGPVSGYVEQVFEHDLTAEPRRLRSRRSREPGDRPRRLPGLPPGPASTPLRLADARRGDIRRRDRAVDEPPCGAARRESSRRARRARRGRKPFLRARARRVGRSRQDRGVRCPGRRRSRKRPG